GEQVCGGTEGLLHHPQLLVTEHGLERIEIGVGAQHEAPATVPCGPTTRSMMLRLIAIALERHHGGPDQDVQIEEKAPIVDVPQIEIDPFLHVSEMLCLAPAAV